MDAVGAVEDAGGVVETDDWSRGTRGSPAAAADGEDASYARGDERGALNPLVPVDAPDAMVMDDRGDGALAAAAAAMREGFGGGLGAEGEGAASAVWNAPLQEWLSTGLLWWCGGIARLAVRKVQAVYKGFVPELDVLLLRLDRRVVDHDHPVGVAQDGRPTVFVLLVARAVPNLDLRGSACVRW